MAPSHTPSWRDHELPIDHNLECCHADGIEHLHMIRADTLDEALVYIKKLKLCIAAAKAKSPSQAVDTKEAGSISPRRCAIHNTEMTRRMSKRTGKLYSAHDTAEGSVSAGHNPRTGLNQISPSSIYRLGACLTSCKDDLCRLIRAKQFRIILCFQINIYGSAISSHSFYFYNRPLALLS
jgi:hypothetical protein